MSIELTEAFHLLTPNSKGADALRKFIAKGGLSLWFFEQETLSQWWHLLRMRKSIKARRQAMPRRVDQADIEALMEG